VTPLNVEESAPSSQSSVLVVAPLALENEDIKAREGEELLFEEKTLNTI